MSKFPEPPSIEALRRIAAETLELPAGTPLARIYFSAGPYPSHWNRFRRIGPAAARWDHHLPSAGDEPTEQDRAVLYCAPQVDTCAAEVFQATRRIDRIRNAPALAVFVLHVPVILLDLRGAFATRIGASTAIHSGPRSRARAWARQLYEAYPEIQGFRYGSSMNGHAPAIVLNERAQGALPKEPQFHRALNDDMLCAPTNRSAALIRAAVAPKGATETTSPAPPGAMLTINQAQKALAATFRVPPEHIELTIQGQLVYLACTCADTTTTESRMLNR